MPQAIVDPGNLREFAANLQRYNELVADATANLQGQFAQLGDTWRDQNQVAFASEFEQAVRAISRFQEVSEQQIRHLLKQAEVIEEYERLRNG